MNRPFLRNKRDDGRAILLEKHAGLLGCYFVLGGEIDNIYDGRERLDAENFVGIAVQEHARSGVMDG